VNYWPRFINAITNATAHLSLAEMGAYDRLLDHYYKAEQPLPGDLDSCCRIVRAIGKADRQAVASVLRQFFQLADGVYKQVRADDEIALGLKKIEIAKANGKLGGRRPQAKKEPSGLPAANPAGSDPLSDSLPSGQAPHPHPNQNTTSVDPPQRAGGCEGEFFDVVGDAKPTLAGQVCKAMRMEGIADTNPGHPRLLSLLQAGATVEEFTGFAAGAAAAGKGFAWVLGAVEGERKRAADSLRLMHVGAMPPKTARGQVAASLIAGTSLDRQQFNTVEGNDAAQLSIRG